jgi:hypothetical protein
MVLSTQPNAIIRDEINTDVVATRHSCEQIGLKRLLLSYSMVLVHSIQATMLPLRCRVMIAVPSGLAHTQPGTTIPEGSTLEWLPCRATSKDL